jgi:hypothetical protein
VPPESRQHRAERQVTGFLNRYRGLGLDQPYSLNVDLAVAATAAAGAAPQPPPRR